jgi:hypothetical protein
MIVDFHANFPASVIRIRTLPPACVISGCALASPVRSNSASNPAPKPFARKIASVQPWWLPASMSSARRLSPVKVSQNCTCWRATQANVLNNFIK